MMVAVWQQIEPDYYRSPPGHRYRFEGSGRAHRIKGYASGLKFHKDWERTDDNHLCNVLTELKRYRYILVLFTCYKV
tara:strand:+ start:322 stop:552 length:231 start_codon:yes stop_codon:yes gene_type:complete